MSAVCQALRPNDCLWPPLSRSGRNLTATRIGSTRPWRFWLPNVGPQEGERRGHMGGTDEAESEAKEIGAHK